MFYAASMIEIKELKVIEPQMNLDETRHKQLSQNVAMINGVYIFDTKVHVPSAVTLKVKSKIQIFCKWNDFTEWWFNHFLDVAVV